MSHKSDDFDFLFSSWKIHNRFLTARLQDSNEWVEFDATSTVEPLLNGLGNIERFSAVRNGVETAGITLRLFNPLTEQWSLYWADTVRAGVLQAPMIGKFHDGKGQFLGDEEVAGKKVLCRFLWEKRHSDGLPRWEQAFSDDGGKNWETNWIMSFSPQR